MGELMIDAGGWRKSSRSGSEESKCVEVARGWRKSSHSGTEKSECVEVARTAQLVAVRDSKDPAGAILAFAPAEWRAFLDVLKDA